MAIYKVRELIEWLKIDYDPNEVIAYTIYSKGDVESLLKHKHQRPDISTDEVWEEVIEGVNGAIETSQGDINSYLHELVSAEVDQYEDPEEGE